MKHIKIILSFALLSATTLNAGWMDTLTEGITAVGKTVSEKEEAKPEKVTTEKAVTSITETDSQSTSSIVSSLTSKDMDGALKEALNKGVSYAVESLGKENGYMNNALTKIILPDNLQKTAELVRKAGGDKYVDDLILAMNNAATEAAPKTAVVFSKSISDMSIDDAKKILSGSDNAATDYFRNTTTKDLEAIISPIIQKSMESNDVAKYYETFQSFYKENSGMLDNEYVSGAASMLGYGDALPSEKDEDINGYITNKSIDGIMVMIQEQEKVIREHPLAQNNDLIGKVFSAFE